MPLLLLLLLLVVVVVVVDLGVDKGPVLFQEIQEAITVEETKERRELMGWVVEGMEEVSTPLIGKTGKMERKIRGGESNQNTHAKALHPCIPPHLG